MVILQQNKACALICIQALINPDCLKISLDYNLKRKGTLAACRVWIKDHFPTFCFKPLDKSIIQNVQTASKDLTVRDPQLCQENLTNFELQQFNYLVAIPFFFNVGCCFCWQLLNSKDCAWDIILSKTQRVCALLEIGHEEMHKIDTIAALTELDQVQQLKAFLMASLHY